MGSDSSKPERIIVNNVPSVSPQKDMDMSSLNLSIEEIIKEISIVVLVVFIWEYIKKQVNKRVERSNEKLARAFSTNNLNQCWQPNLNLNRNLGFFEKPNLTATEIFVTAT
jgi:hypothetical protein